jgi:hypothetical protein
MGRSFRLFKPYLGKTTFESLKEPMQAGEYTMQRGASLFSFSRPNALCQVRKGVSQSSYTLLKREKTVYCNMCNDPYNPASLNTNLVTKLNLLDVPVILEHETNSSDPAYLSATVIPYIAYRIDPSGNLFGNTICGANNFTEYIEYTEYMKP